MNAVPPAAANDKASPDVPGLAGVRPYENFGDVSPVLVHVAADDILDEGWKVPGYPTLPINAPVPWQDRGAEDRSWTFRIHSLDMVNELLLAHSATGKGKYLQPALRICLDWSRKHLGDDTDGPSQFAWYDMAVGLRAPRLAYVLDAAERKGLLDDRGAPLLRDALERHRAHLADDANIAFHNNHGFYQVAGQLAMGRRWRGRLPGMDAAFAQGSNRLARMLSEQFTDEGVHREHSPDYHRMVYDTLAGIVEAGLVEDPQLRALTDRIEDALAWFVMPDGSLLNFGDSDSRLMLRSSADTERKWRRDAMRFVASGGRVGMPPTSPVMVFPDSGYYIARDAWQADTGAVDGGGYLALNGAFHSRTHKHADDLSLVWYDRGAPLLVDAGRYGYVGKTEQGSELWRDGFWYSDPRRIYVESTRAHNTVEVDGRNYERRGISPWGSAVRRHGEAVGVRFCEMETRHFGSIRHARTVLWAPSRWLLVVDWLHDNVGEAHRFRQWHHLSPGLSAYPDRGGFIAMAPRSSQPLHIHSLLAGPAATGFELGAESPVLQGFYSPREKVIIPNYALSFDVDRTDTACFATLFCFADTFEHDQERSGMAGSGRSGYFRWRADGVRHVLTLARQADQPIKIEYKVGS